MSPLTDLTMTVGGPTYDSNTTGSDYRTLFETTVPEVSELVQPIASAEFSSDY